MSPQQSKKFLTKYLYKVLKSLGVKVFRPMLITDCSKPENSVWNISVQIVLLMAWANTLGRDCLGQDSANCGPQT